MKIKNRRILYIIRIIIQEDTLIHLSLAQGLALVQNYRKEDDVSFHCHFIIFSFNFNYHRHPTLRIEAHRCNGREHD